MQIKVFTVLFNRITSKSHEQRMKCFNYPAKIQPRDLKSFRQKRRSFNLNITSEAESKAAAGKNESRGTGGEAEEI